MLEYYTKQVQHFSSQIEYQCTTKKKKKKNNEEILGICITINTTESCTDIQQCMTSEEVREVTLEDEHMSALVVLILCSWPATKI